jgi:predicted branched-subunit amino acid permease
LASGNNKPVRQYASTLRDALGLSLAVGLYGIAFGAAAVAAGFSVAQSCVMSLLMFTGGSQFAAVSVVAGGGGLASAFGASALLGTRNTLYGLQMNPLVRPSGFTKLAAAQVTIDESTGVALGQAARGTPAMRVGFWATGLGVYFFWNLFTLVGALGAKALGSPAAWGLDGAVPAAFLALVWPRLTNGFTRTVSLVAACFSLAIAPFVPAGVPIISTALVAVVFGWRAP